MKRRKRRSAEDRSSLDSFLDVICNLAGGLLLVALISALASSTTVFDVVAPVEQESEDAVPFDFAITPAGVYPLDASKAAEELEKNAVKDQEGQITASAETKYFMWRVSTALSLVLCRLKSDQPPPITDQNIRGIFNVLSEMRVRDKSGKSYFAFFLVSPDDKAFRLFRLARKELWAKGIKVGWAPCNPEQGIAFGAGGRPVQPQR